MGNMKIRPITETLIYSAVSVLFMIISMYVQPLSFVSAFLSGIPIMLLMCKSSVSVGIIGLIFAGAIVSLLTADFVTVLTIILFYALPVIVFGICVRVRIKFSSTVFSVAFVILVAMVAQLMILNGTGNGIENLLYEIASGATERVRPVLLQIQATGMFDANIDQVISETTTSIIRTIITFIPTVLIISSIVLGYAISAISIFLLRRLRIQDVKYTKFNMIRIPNSTVAVFIISYFITMIAKDGGVFVAALSNIVMISSLAISLSGFSFIDFVLSKRIKSGYIRAIIYLAVFIFGAMLISLITDIFFIVGIFCSRAIMARFIENGDGGIEKK